MRIPDKVELEGLERKWGAFWEEHGLYRFDDTAPAAQVYAIDTPPPTVSGTLHIGHVFSYTHADIIARYQRMQGKEVFYPIGWDDNGVPTERRVQNYYGVRCDPSLPYRGTDEELPREGARQVPVSRRRFIELCTELTAKDEQAFEQLWRAIGLSVDWSLVYTTVGERARRVSQADFLDLLERDQAYLAEAPTLWDVDFQTTVSQAELEDRTVEGRYHRIVFDLEGGGELEIMSSRPELIPACVAIVVHPEDDRYREVVGRRAITPLFRVPVPVIAHPLAEPERGTGAAMVCTFGDLTDVVWWREASLPTRVVIDRAGRLVPRVDFAAFGSLDPDGAADAYGRLAGLRASDARAEVAEALAAAGVLRGIEQVRHAVKYYEKGEHPLEVLATRQWFIRVLPLRDRLLERAAELDWLPPHMQVRLEDWIRGLNQDWNVSRQRFFGIPIPLWYPVREDGSVDYDHPLRPAKEDLPVDPQSEAPRGYADEQRGVPGGFVGDPDVLDTWATSSLTPQLAGGWGERPDLFAKVFPMELRPQGQEIIRTWLFYTVVRAELAFGRLPWRRALISGWVLDPDRKKMSKSKGNVVTPMPLVERFGADAVRHWAANGRPGTDTAADEAQMRVGRRLAIKVANASRFALSRVASRSSHKPAWVPIDAAELEALDATIARATELLEAHDYTSALAAIEEHFWAFCDDYLELVKVRAYGDDSPEHASALAALEIGVELFIRAFAPYLPFVTEEVWSWFREGSVHRSAWPQPGEAMRRYVELVGEGHGVVDPAVRAAVSWSLAQVRRAKTSEQRSLRTPVERLVVWAPRAWLEALAAAEDDLRAAGGVLALERHEADEPRAVVELAPPEQH
ncbi:aminoacyl-tRNA synthetase class Ia [Acidimicrobium ferrooxidans DSM 10331]|uniref:Valine--tRNA ligase n=1 Tax=Acidimicrobium ferrooxidans (strain DSM 10331 / JCM 15462 / NBRC 103882 / ICP) TaxID=525909 RepID=C7M2N1_ACIFD|nr:aminoacyl-tRNA synthetase class Ia [Acidimicrobium ferrooxidans DSM 10331]